MKECILFNEQSDCIAYLNMSLVLDLFVVFVLFWGMKETFMLILKLMINR